MTTVFAKHPTSALITGGQTQCIMNIKEQGVAQVLGLQAGGSERPAGESGGRRGRRFCGQTTCPRYMCPDFYRKVFQMVFKNKGFRLRQTSVQISVLSPAVCVAWDKRLTPLRLG